MSSVDEFVKLYGFENCKPTRYTESSSRHLAQLKYKPITELWFASIDGSTIQSLSIAVAEL